MGSNCVLIPGNQLSLDGNKPSPNAFSPKELYSSGDEHATKARKPYTITKQRERWTEEEHKLFLEALKLYGRAWRRIEEHIGTKTAVQIRSHAQKFFTKVFRESDFVSSIEIPPPRPKRKPMHPYPRKSVHSFPKGISAPEQLERSPSPIPSVSEPDNRSPTSVLSAVGSDTMGSTVSNPLNGCPSPVSSVAGSNPVGLKLAEQEKGYPSTTLSAEEENRSQTPDAVAAQDKSPLKLETDYKDHVSTKETLSVEAPTTSLKLFGITVLVTDYHKPSSTVAANIPQCNRALPIIDIVEPQEKLDKDTHNPEQTSPRNSTQRDFSVDPCESAWNSWSSGVPPLFYCMPFQQEDLNSAETNTSMPWWALYGSLPFPLIPSHNIKSRVTQSDSHMEASKEVQKEGSWTDSNSGSICEVGVRENSDIVDSQYVESSDKMKEPVTLFHLKPSENSAFSCRAKGFVPYKRCVAERDVEQSQIGGEEREGQRIRLCL
ncbi:protein REVEILLE 1-like isoform X2 [Tasmannia lanceolata]